MGGKNSKLPEEELKRLSEETKYTEAEVAQWYAGFMSDCPSGRMTMQDYAKVCQAFFPNGLAENFSRYVFNSLNLDDAASIDFENFIKFMSMVSRGSVEEKQRWAFHLRDVDHNGKLTKDKLRMIDDALFTMIADHVPLPEDEDTPAKRTEKLFALMDTDDYGNIDLDAFKKACNEDKDIKKALCLYDTVQLKA